MPEGHMLEDCPQAPTIKNLAEAVIRMERTSERTAFALETIAQQGAQVASHEKRLDRHDLDLNECFLRIRPIEQRHAHDEGIAVVEDKNEKYWTEIKLKMFTPVLLGVFFVLWLIDRFNTFQWLAKMWSVMGEK